MTNKMTALLSAPRYILIAILSAAAVPLALALAVLGWLIMWVHR